MKRFLYVVIAAASALWFGSRLVVADAPSGMPDFASMDKQVLVVMCQQLWARVQSQDKLIAELEAKAASDGGGGDEDEDAAGSSDGTWVVKIVSNTEPDLTTLESQLETARADIDTQNEALQSAQRTLNTVLAKGEYGSETNRQGYRRDERVNAEGAVRRAQGQITGARAKVNQLQQQIESARHARTIVGMSEDAKPVKIVARGVYSALGASLTEGQTYVVVGRGVEAGSGITIYIKSADLRRAE